VHINEQRNCLSLSKHRQQMVTLYVLIIETKSRNQGVITKTQREKMFVCVCN